MFQKVYYSIQKVLNVHLGEQFGKSWINKSANISEFCFEHWNYIILRNAQHE